MPGSQDRGARPSLAEFVASRPWRGGSSAWCCHVVPPELMAEIEEAVAEARAAGLAPRWAAYADWLIECGVPDATKAKIEYHFERGHHRRPQ